MMLAKKEFCFRPIGIPSLNIFSLSLLFYLSGERSLMRLQIVLSKAQFDNHVMV